MIFLGVMAREAHSFPFRSMARWAVLDRPLPDRACHDERPSQLDAIAGFQPEGTTLRLNLQPQGTT